MKEKFFWRKPNSISFLMAKFGGNDFLLHIFNWIISVLIIIQKSFLCGRRNWKQNWCHFFSNNFCLSVLFLAFDSTGMYVYWRRSNLQKWEKTERKTLTIQNTSLLNDFFFQLCFKVFKKIPIEAKIRSNSIFLFWFWYITFFWIAARKLLFAWISVIRIFFFLLRIFFTKKTLFQHNTIKRTKTAN